MTTLKIDTKALAGLHSALKDFAPKRTKIPIFGFFHAEGDGQRLRMRATDGDIERISEIDCETVIAPVCLPPYIVEVAGGVAAMQVALEIDDRQITAKAGRSRFRGAVLPGGDFPCFDFGLPSPVEVNARGLATILSTTLDAVSIEDARYYLEGVHLEISVPEGGNAGDRHLIAVATDGHRLHTASIPAPDGLMMADSIIIPTKAAREIYKLAAKSGDAPIRFACTDRGVMVESGRERITSKLIDGTFPDWRRVAPNPTGCAATFDIGEMIAALDRALKIQSATRTFAKGESKSSAPITLEEDDDVLTIAAKGDASDASDAIACEFSTPGKWRSRGLNGSYLHATLSAMRDRGGDTATIDVSDPGAPMRLESPTDEDVLAIIMPVRLPNT